MWPDCKDKAVSLVALGLHEEEQSLELTAFEKYTMAAIRDVSVAKKAGKQFQRNHYCSRVQYLFASQKSYQLDLWS